MSGRSTARQAFFELSLDMLCIADSHGSFIDVNEAWTYTLGWTAEELCAVPFTDFVHPDDVAATINEAMALNEGCVTVNFENRYQHKDGTYVWLNWKATLVPNPDSEDGGHLIFAVARDVSERRRLETALQHLADHDGLTGIWCRRRFAQEVELQVARSRRYDEHAALFLVDLDLFKRVNDTHGHQTGDLLLKHVAQLLKARARASDCVGRLGGDEFAMLVPHMGPDQAAATVQSIAAHLRDHPFEHDGQLLPITVSTGIAFINKDTPDVDHVMLEADRAMYDCKAAGRGSTSGLRQPRTVHGPRTRVFHCDDSEAYRRLLTEMLTAHDDIEVKGGATTREEALRRVGDVDPDVIVLDALMHDNPSSFLAELKAHCPTSAVLVLSGLDICPAALAQGADGFIGKRRTFDDIADAIRAVMRTGRAVGEHP